MKVLSVICARAGSKGLKNKCVSQINGKMVVEYAIEYSLSLGKEVKTVVSTDIETLIEYCKKKNIAYINRKAEFCADQSKIDDALADAIENQGQNCEYCSIVYGNIATRYPEIFHAGFDFLEKNQDFDAAISMQNVEKFHPEWMFDYNADILPQVKETHYRRQMLAQKMIHDGHTLLFRTDKFMKKYKGLIKNSGNKYSIFGDKIKPLINSNLIIDIDTKKDLELVEKITRNI